jgi:DNA gyrase subunit B
VSEFFKLKPVKLEACALSGPGSTAELFIVEGDSACSAVSGVRSQHFQAVLPMQGKPLNALRANAKKVAAFELYQALQQALGVPAFDSMAADLPAGPAPAGPKSDSPESASPKPAGPMLAAPRFDRVLLLFDPDADGIHCGALMLMYFYRWMRPLLESGRIEMVRAPLFDIKSYRYRGLGNIDPALLAQTCVNPKTRKTSIMGIADAQACIDAFGPTRARM